MTRGAGREGGAINRGRQLLQIFRSKGAIIRGRRFIKGQLLFEEIRYTSKVSMNLPKQ